PGPPGGAPPPPPRQPELGAGPGRRETCSAPVCNLEGVEKQGPRASHFALPAIERALPGEQCGALDRHGYSVHRLQSSIEVLVRRVRIICLLTEHRPSSQRARSRPMTRKIVRHPLERR